MSPAASLTRLLPQGRKQAEGEEVLAQEDANTVIITITITLTKVFAVN